MIISNQWTTMYQVFLAGNSIPITSYIDDR